MYQQGQRLSIREKDTLVPTTCVLVSSVASLGQSTFLRGDKQMLLGGNPKGLYAAWVQRSSNQEPDLIVWAGNPAIDSINVFVAGNWRELPYENILARSLTEDIIKQIGEKPVL